MSYLVSAGLDATNAFEDVGHSTDAREVANKYLIGVVADPLPEPKVCASIDSRVVWEWD